MELTFEMSTAVRVSKEMFWEFIHELKKKDYYFQFEAGYNKDYSTDIIVVADDLTPAQAEAFIQLCVRFNQAVMPT